jgi:hypothetical protein
MPADRSEPRQNGKKISPSDRRQRGGIGQDQGGWGVPGGDNGWPGSPKQVLCKKLPTEVDESAWDPLISLKYPVGD